MRRAVANLRHRSLVRTFDLWVYRVSEGAAKEQMLLLFDMDRLKEGMKDGGRWRARRAASAPSARTFLRGAVASSRLALRAGRLTSRWRGPRARYATSEVAKGWRGWAQVTAAKREERRRVLNAVGEWRGARRMAAWRTWLEYRSERIMLSRAVACIRNPALRMMLARWSEVAKEGAARDFALSGAITSWTMQHVRQGFNSWVDHASELKALSKPLLSLMHPELRRCFATWEDTAVRWAMARLLATRCARLLLHRGASRAYRQWATTAANLQLNTMRMRAASSFVAPRMRRGWMGWVSYMGSGRSRRRSRTLHACGRERAVRLQAARRVE